MAGAAPNDQQSPPGRPSINTSVRPFTVAIMQPYFIPYAGYFRLFAASDLLVIYDCVQFPRRGWVHRNRLVDASGQERWLTLPLERAPQTVLIRDLRFPPDAREIVAERLSRFPLAAKDGTDRAKIVDALRAIAGSPVDYIESVLHAAVSYLGLPWNTLRSSSLDIPARLRGQDRILAILERVAARRYVNAPGGRSLYRPAAFDAAGVELQFLTDYPGPTTSIMTRVLTESRDDIASEIEASARQQPSESEA